MDPVPETPETKIEQNGGEEVSRDLLLVELDDPLASLDPEARARVLRGETHGRKESIALHLHLADLAIKEAA